MLVCPQCHLENPNNSSICQKCDTSLTHKSCHQCGTSVSFKDETCGNCGAFTATVWRAIIAEAGEGKLDIQSSIDQEPYLDLARRYRLSSSNGEELPGAIAPNSTYQVFCGKVIDCQPLQKSVLEVLVEQQTELVGDLDGNGEQEGTTSSLWYRIGIPKLAQPYLSLKKFAPMVPKVHDAWQEGKKEVILLSDRSQWQLLFQYWQTKALSLEQIVQYLQEIAKFWEVLVPLNSTQTLLLETNLRIDGNKKFGVQQLYSDPSEQSGGLPELGKMWQQLLAWSDREQWQSLHSLITQLAEGEIATLSALQEKLEQLTEKASVEIKLDTDKIAEMPRDRAITNETESLETKPTPSTANLERSPLVDDRDQEFIVYSQPKLNRHFDSEPPVFIDDELEEEDLSTAELPMQLYSLSDAGATDVGRQRNHNEDCFTIKSHIKRQQNNRGNTVQARGLYILCDGMGGHAAGEVASSMAVDRLLRYFKSNWGESLPDKETIQAGIIATNQAIYQINQKNATSGNGRMGTTMVLALVQDMKVAIAHVGDSRIYLINRKWGLEQLTVDHEVGQRAIQSGVDPKIAYGRPGAHQLTQALGPHDSNFVQPDIRFLDLHEDTLLLLCSDGLSDRKFVENHWETHLSPLISSSANLDEGVEKLIAFANEKNGHDNITAILVRIKVRPKFGMGLS